MSFQLSNLQVVAGTPAKIGFDVTGPAGSNDNVLIQFELNGVRKAATPFAGSSSANPVAAAGAAAPQHYDFSWDVTTDLGTPRPTVVIYASLVSDPTVSVFVPFPAPPSVAQLTVAPGNPPTLNFVLIHGGSSPCTLEVQFSADAGPWLPATPSGSPPANWPSSAAGQPGSYVWNAAHDLAPPPSTVGVQVRPTANGDVGAWTTLTGLAYRAVVNTPPRIIYADAYPQATELDIRYTLTDAESEPCSVLLEFTEVSVPPPAVPVWTPLLPITGTQPNAVATNPAGTRNVFAWNTRAQFAGRLQYPTVQVRLTPSDQYQQGAAYTIQNFIPNSPVQVWNVVPARGNPFRIFYTLKDIESDPCSVAAFYSIDDTKTWNPATPAAGTKVTGLASSPAGVQNIFEWDALTDLGTAKHPMVIFRISPTDVGPGVDGSSRPFVLNFPPTCTITSVIPADPTIVDFDLLDQEGDVCSVKIAYSLDSGATWNPATEAQPGGATPHLLSIAGQNHHAVAWDARRDLGSIDLKGVRIQITPSDLEGGTPAVSNPFDVNLAPNAPPTISTPSVTPGAYRGYTVIGVNLADAEADPAFVEVEYSLDSGKNWHAALISAPSLTAGALATSAAGVHYDFQWDAWADLGETLAKGVLVQVLARDQQGRGGAVSTAFDVDTRPPQPPVIQNLALDPVASVGPVVASFDLLEPEGRDCGIEALCSLDGGVTWNPATPYYGSSLPALSSRRASANGVHQYFAWDALADLRTSTKVRLRLTANTTRPGAPVEIDFLQASLPATVAPPPLITNAVASQAGPGEPVLVSFTVTDRSCRSISVAINYVDTSGNAKPATDLGAANGGSLQGLVATPSGTPAVFAWDCATDLHGTPGNYSFTLTPTQLFGIPGAGVPAAAIAVNATALKQNPPQILNLDVRPADRDGTIALRFALTDLASNPSDFTAQWQAAATAVLQPATLLAPFTHMQGIPAGAATEILWNAVADGGAGTFTGLRLSLIANNGQASTPVLSGAFNARLLSLHPKTLAATAISVLTAKRREPVSIAVDLNDPIPEYSKMELRFSVQGPDDWHPATILKDWQMRVLSSGATRGLYWDVSSDLPAGTYSQLRLEATPIDSTGRRGRSVRGNIFTLQVWPPEALPPVATNVQLIPGAAGDPVAIQVQVADREGLSCDLTAEYSLDSGGSWSRASLAPTSSARGLAVTPQGTVVTLYWDVSTDLPYGNYPSVSARVTPKNPWVGNPAVSPAIAMVVAPRTPQAPAVVNLTAHGATNDEFPFSANLIHPRSSSAMIDVRWSTDGGATWHLATPGLGVERFPPGGFDTAPTPGAVLNWWWDLAADLGPSASIPNATVRVTATAEGLSASANLQTGPLTTSAVPAANPALAADPLVDATSPEQVQIAVVITDPASVPADVSLSWSTDGGATWNKALGVSSAETIALSTNPNGEEHLIEWNARRDLSAKLWPSVRVQATCGSSVHASQSFALDLSGPVSTAPALSALTFQEFLPLVIVLEFTLTDDRSLSCSVKVEFTCQERPGWNTAREATATGYEPFQWVANASGIEHRWYWSIFRDLGLGTWHNIQVRVTASDGAQQAQAVVTIGDRTLSAIAPAAHLAGVALETRYDAIRRSAEYALDCAPPGPVDLQYQLITPATTVPATMIGAPDEVYAGDGGTLVLCWDANTDVSAALDNQPLTLRVEASRSGTVVATADLDAKTTIATRGASPFVSASIDSSSTGVVTAPVRVNFSVNDPLARPDDVLIEYSRDGGNTWLEAKVWPGDGDGRQAFETATGSTDGTFVWDIERNISERYATGVLVRASLRSQPAVAPGVTDPFDIDMGAPDGHTPTSFASAQDGSGPVVPIEVDLYDPDGELVTFDLEFFSPLNGTWMTATAADGSDLLTAAPAQPEGTEYRYLWDAQADAGQIFPPGSPPAGPVDLRATVRKARAASLADSHTLTVNIDASAYDPGLRDYPDIRPGTLKVTGGIPQTAVGGQLLATPITLNLVDKTGAAIANAEVQLFVAQGSAINAEIPASVYTDDKGNAQVQVRPADGQDGKLDLSARVVGAPNCQLAQNVSITVKASKVVLVNSSSFTLGDYGWMTFQFGSDDPNAGMSIAYGRPVELLITADNWRFNRRLVRLTGGSYPPGSLPTFMVDAAPQDTANLDISVAYPGSSTSLFKPSQPSKVDLPAKSQRQIGDATFSDAQPKLVPVSGDDPDQHVEGTRWPAAGKEQWGWPGLTLTTPFRVKLLIDGKGDGPSPQPPSVSGGGVVIVDPPPPDPPGVTHNCDGVTNSVTAVGSLNQATAVGPVQVNWSANGGTLSKTPTSSPGDPNFLSAGICENVFFTPTTDGPWSVTASVDQNVLDPGRQYWTHSYTDPNGQQHIAIYRGDALWVSVNWVFEIQQAPVFLVYDDAQATQADRVSAGVNELILARVSPSAGVSTRQIAINAMQRDGTVVFDYTGPRKPPPFSNSNVVMKLQASGKELRSDTFTFVRGEPDNQTASMLSFLRSAWVQVTALAVYEPLVLATDPPLRARLPLNGRPSIQDAIAGTTPFAGWEGTVSLSDCELIYPSGILDIVTAFGNLSLFRTWRGHLTWERRSWMKDDESRVQQWAGAFGPGWIGGFETELVPLPGEYRFMDASGRVMRIPGTEPANGLIARVVTNSQIDDDHAPIHLTFPTHGELRFYADGTLREIVDARKHLTKFTYGQNSQLKTITDPHGHQITFTPSAGNSNRVGSISDANQRTVTFSYQPDASGNVQGMLGSSTGPAADSKYGGPSQSFAETYHYEGATAAAPTLVPYAQVRLKEVLRAGELKIKNTYTTAGGVQKQEWNGGSVTYTQAPGTTRYLLVVFRDNSQQGLTFEGGGADAAAPTQIQEFTASSGSLRTSKYQYNSQCRLVRAELPDNLVHRWTYNDNDPSIDIFSRGNLLAHEIIHTIAPPPPPPGSAGPARSPVPYKRVTSWEYNDWQNPASPTAMIPPESSTRRTQRSWRTDVTYSSYGEIAQIAGPAARSTRVTENAELFGPSPAPYTLDHKSDRPTIVIQYNNDGLVITVQSPDGIVTQYAYYSLANFNSGSFSPDGAGLVAQEQCDTADNNDRQFWYLDQPVVVRQTLLTYDSYGYLSSTTDSRGCQQKVSANALGLPLRIESGIPPAGMAGQSVVRRTEYDDHWRASKRILEQPNGTAENGGFELAETVTEFDNEDRQITVTRTIAGTDTLTTKVRRGVEGFVDGGFRPGGSGLQPKEIVSVDQREERGLPATTSFKFGRHDQTMPVKQAWDDHAAPKSLSVRSTDIQIYRGGAFGSIGGATDPGVGVTKDFSSAMDGSADRLRLASTGPTVARSPKRPPGTYGFEEIRRNEWGLERRMHRDLNARPGSGSGAPPGISPDPPVEGVPGGDPNFLGNVSVDRNDAGFGPGDGKATTEIEYDILGRETLCQDDRTNTQQTTWSPFGIKLRERLGERNQLAWDDPAVPWRDQRWRWQPGTDWISEVHRQLDSNGDPTQETTILQTGTTSVQRSLVNTYSFDSLGRIASVTDPLGGTTRYTYDVHGEIATMTDANGVLDATGKTNVDGNKTTWIRDGLGRVVRIQMDMVQGGIAGPSAASAGSIQRSFTYTPEGQIATVTDAQKFTTTWNYGPNGQLESVVTPKPRAFGPTETVKQSITYDDFGRPSTRTSASGATRQMIYNAAQQLEQVEITAGSVKGTLKYLYHPLGPLFSTELIWVANDWTPAGYQQFREVRSIEYDIDSNGRVDGELQYGARRNMATGAVQTFERKIQYTYDGQGLRSGLVYSDGQSFRMDLDRAGRTLGVIRGKEEIVLRYEMLGEDFVWSRKSGVVLEQRDVDAAGHPSSIQVSANGTTVVQHTFSDRDRCGRIKTWKRSAMLASGQVDDTRTFTYDSAGRVVGETANYATVGSRTVTRQYDGDGTLVLEQRTDTPLTGPATTRIKKSIRGGGGAIFETIVNTNGVQTLFKTFYDLDGNVRDDGRVVVQHDALGRLVWAMAWNGSGQTRYTYDSNNRLVACTRLDLNDNENFREDYVWDDWRLIEVWRGGTLHERYVYGRGLNEIVRAEINGVAWFPVYGPDGSVDCILNDTGEVVESYAYDLDGVGTVFDNQRRPVSRAPLFRFGFHGHFYDPVTRFVYMRERWYSPYLAQFFQEDPLGAGQSVNLYALCAGDVINQMDPYGRLSWGQWAGLGVAILVGAALMAVTGGAAIALLGPIWGVIAAGALVGAVSGVAGELVEANIDGREAHILQAALVGAVLGGVFSGVGAWAVRNPMVRALGSRAVAWAAGTRLAQRALSASYYARFMVPVREAAAALESRSAQAGEWLGKRLGGWFATNAVASAERRALDAGARNLALQTGSAARRGFAEVGQNPVRLGLKTVERTQVTAALVSDIPELGTATAASGGKFGVLVESGGRATGFVTADAAAAAAEQSGMESLVVGHARRLDADVKLFGVLVSRVEENVAGQVAFGASMPVCPSCYKNLWVLRALRSNLFIRLATPTMERAAAQGAAGAAIGASGAASRSLW